jgi:adenine/guanine phosphoribosyltransferase-like PRPP-binding protein
MNEENTIDTFPKYSTQCAGNSPDVKRLIAKIKRRLQSNKAELPDYFVGLGNSGCALASILSFIFDTPMVYIRKGHISRFTNSNSTTDRQGHPNIFPKQIYPSYDAEVTKNVGVVSPYLGKTYWFVDDCIDSGKTFNQTIYLCTMRYGMVLSGIALTSTNGFMSADLKEMAKLKQNVPLTIFASLE